MTMQLQMADQGNRFFNAERDLVNLLPYLLKSALSEIGPNEDVHYVEKLVGMGFDPDKISALTGEVGAIQKPLGTLVERLLALCNRVREKGVPAAERSELLATLFSEKDPTQDPVVFFRMMLADILFHRLIASYMEWAEDVRIDKGADTMNLDLPTLMRRLEELVGELK